MTRSRSEISIASAGAGKTTTLVKKVLDRDERAAVTTYTINNVNAISKRLTESAGSIPSKATLSPWFSFLLRDLIRPYQNYFTTNRITGINFIQGRSAPRTKKGTHQHYLDKHNRVYTDKLASLALHLIKLSGGRVLERLAQLYSRIYIDEAQDIAGPGLDLIETLMKSEVPIHLVGDTRQVTYSTNNAAKNSGFRGSKVLQKYRSWEKAGLCKIHFINESYRCCQAICNTADSLFPDHERTISRNTKVTGHDGVFVIPPSQVHSYLDQYPSQALRFDRRTRCDIPSPLNFGASKGLEFGRVIIFPNGPIRKWLESGDPGSVSAMVSRAKLYVALTRARHSVAFVHGGKCGHSSFFNL